MKAIFIYNKNSGKIDIKKKLKYIKKRLLERFSSLDIYEPNSIIEFSNKIILESSNYDAIIISGGDGTFNLLVNALKCVDKKPIIGYLPTGTACDDARKFGISKNLKKALDIICKGETKLIDVMEVNNTFSTYVLAKGKFVNASYATDRGLKKFFGKFGYIVWGIKELFIPHKRMIISVHANNMKITKKCQMIFISNSNSIAGRKFKNELDKDEFCIYFFEKSLLRVVLFFVFGLKAAEDLNKVLKINTKKARISLIESKNIEWSNDGEEYKARVLDITNIDNFLEIYAPKN